MATSEPRFRQRRVRTLSERRRSAFLIGLMHAAPALALFIGPNPLDWWILACVYPFHAIGIGVSLLRYFAHRSFKTSRAFQLFLALCSASVFGDPIGFELRAQVRRARDRARAGDRTLTQPPRPTSAAARPARPMPRGRRVPGSMAPHPATRRGHRYVTLG